MVNVDQSNFARAAYAYYASNLALDPGDDLVQGVDPLALDLACDQFGWFQRPEIPRIAGNVGEQRCGLRSR